MRLYPHRALRYSAKSLGNHIKAAREGHGMIRAQLARESGVHPTTLHDIEKGNKQASLETLVRLCSRLGLSLDAVTSFEKTEPNTLTVEELKLISIYRRIPKCHLRKAFQLLEIMTE